MIGDDGRELGVLRLDDVGQRALTDGPVIPNFGQGSSCVQGDHFFCSDWVRQHWGDTLQPALVQHLELTAIAIAIGFALAFALALARAPLPTARAADRRSSSALIYTIPSIALFQLLVPFTGITTHDRRDRARRATRS